MTIKKAEARIPDDITPEEWAQASLTDRIIYAAGSLHEIIIDKAFKSNDVAVGLMAAIYDTLDAIRSQSRVGDPVAWRYRPASRSDGWAYSIEEPVFSCPDHWFWEPLYAAPVQPALEWNGRRLWWNGKQIGHIEFASSDQIPDNFAARFMDDLLTNYTETEVSAKSSLESAARQWLSIGDK